MAYTLLLEIDDIRRFASVRHVHSYCRVVPGSMTPAARPDTNAPGTAIATSRSRSIMPLFERCSTSPRFGPFTRAGCAGRGNPSRALVAKELAQIFYNVLAKGEPFHGRFASITLTQTKQPQRPRRANPPAKLLLSEAPPLDWGARRAIDREHLSRKACRTV